MPKVKLVVAEHTGYDDYYSHEVIRAGISEWEDVSEEDYNFLKNNEFRLAGMLNVPGSVYVVKQDEVPVVKRIASLKKLIKDEQERREKEEAERLLKKEQAALKRKLAKQAKTKAERQQLYAALKDEFEKDKAEEE